MKKEKRKKSRSLEMLGWSELRTQSYQLLSAHENRTQKKIKIKKGKNLKS